MALDDIVSVQITKETIGLTELGFGTALIMSAEAEEDSRFVGTAKEYTDLDELGSTGDNYDAEGVTYLKAQALFQQNPRPDKIVVGKRANLPLMTLDMIPIVVADTDYTIAIAGRGVADSFTFNSGPTPTVASIITGLVALINAGTQDVLATDNTTDMDLESADAPGGSATAGKPFTVEYDRSLWTVQNVTADPGIVADVDNVRNAVDGNDDWYAALIDSYGAAEITALAASIEATGYPGKIFLATTSDADVAAAGGGNLAETLQALLYERTALMWHENPHAGPEAAWAGARLPKDPGSVTWKFTRLVGQSPSALTTTEKTNLRNQNVNRYVQITADPASASVCDGNMIGGEWIDVTRGLDFVVARIQERVFGLLLRSDKIPFTDDGIAQVKGEVQGVMELGIRQSIFTDSPRPVVTAPRAADVSANDKANRLLPDVDFSATLAGAVHAVEVQGTVSV